jgi:hypothetical protein
MILLQVDLETGKRRSWLETEEKEMIDLCRETPDQLIGTVPGIPRIKCCVPDPDLIFYFNAFPYPNSIRTLYTVSTLQTKPKRLQINS